MFAFLVISFLVVFIIIIKENHAKLVEKRRKIRNKQANSSLNAPEIIEDKIDFKENTLENNVEAVIKKVVNAVSESPIIEGAKVWTYIEPFKLEKEIQLLSRSGDVPVFFDMCIQLMKKYIPNVIVITPQNIREYLPNFPIRMHHASHIPIRKRVDLLFTFLLEKYGGICISPGTVIYNSSMIQSLINKIYTNDIVTVGTSPHLLHYSTSKMTPNTYIIGAKKQTKFIRKYKREFVKNLKKRDVQHSYDILSQLLKKEKPSQFHITSEYDGSHNTRKRLLTLDDYVGRFPIHYLNAEKMYVISVPYERLIRSSEHRWFLNLSKEQFKDLNIEIVRKINEARER